MAGSKRLSKKVIVWELCYDMQVPNTLRYPKGPLVQEAEQRLTAIVDERIRIIKRYERAIRRRDEVDRLAWS